MLQGATPEHVGEEDIRKFVGQRVALQLVPGNDRPSSSTGVLVSVTEALDGLIAWVQPDGAPEETRDSYHYHNIKAISAA